MEEDDFRFIFDRGISTETDLMANATGFVLDFFHLPSGDSVTFKAMLKNYKPNYDIDVDKKKSYGRMDPVLHYGGTSRSENISWVVPSVSEVDAIANMDRLNRLIQFLYPGYDKTLGEFIGNSNTISTSPLMKLKFANLIMDSNRPRAKTAKDGGLLGMITSFDVEPNIDMGMFEIEDHLFFKEFTISLTFDVNHQHSLGHDKTRFKRQGFPYDIKNERRVDADLISDEGRINAQDGFSEEATDLTIISDASTGGTLNQRQKDRLRELQEAAPSRKREVNKRSNNKIARNITGV